MHATLKQFVFVLCSFAMASAWAQNPPPLTQSIQVSINGARLKGTAEIGPLLAGKSTAEQQVIFDQAVKPIRRNSSFQLVVTAVSAKGVKVDMTKNARLRYVSDDECLTISKQGFVSVVPSGDCIDARRPSLVVSLLSSDLSSVVGLNEYFFRVTD